MQDIVKDIRKQCRLAMNGVTSASMREKGVSYKLNFGLVIQQINAIASKYEQNAELADFLWKEDVRELKILATMLFPIDSFSKDVANRWVSEIPNQEIREQVCLNLFQNLPYAEEIALEWSNEADGAIRTTGYWLLVRLYLLKKMKEVFSDAFLYIWEDVLSEDTFLQKASLLALKHIGRQSKSEADHILEKLSIYKNIDDLVKQEVYNSLAFEFEYYFPE
ncbi:MAG: DNA alkylation repair protein [Dysgonomonas sp.]|nr:DNA alkylation repair protein [Dysgonomonas sp.]